jgi:aquaporin Z
MNNLSIVAEFLGTFLLILSILVTGNAFVIGASLAVIILLIGGVSGAHVIPAVSLAIFLKGGLSVTELLSYLGAQYVGGISALYAYKSFA